MWGGSPMPRGCTSPPRDVRWQFVLLAGLAEPHKLLWHLLCTARCLQAQVGVGCTVWERSLFVMGCQPQLQVMFAIQQYFHPCSSPIAGKL